MDSSDDERPKKIPYAMLKKLQADSSNVKVPQKVVQQRKMTGAQRALQKAIESSQDKAKKSKTKPTEVSNSAPVMPDRPQSVNDGPKKQKARDPRFTETTGKFNSEMFGKAYGFLDNIMNEEREEFKKKLNDRKVSESDKNVIRAKLDKMKTQDSQRSRLTKEREAKSRLRKDEREKVSQGKTPYYHTKSDIARAMETSRFEELKAKGRVESALTKRRKKMEKKDKSLVPRRRTAIEE